MNRLKESELIINSDGSVYHLGIHPEDIRKNVITVGDIDRVDEVIKHFDSIEFTRQNREFKTAGGFVGSTFITVLSTGIGTDNVDIVFNELNFALNYDLQSRERKAKKTDLNIYRLGTSGAVAKEIEIDSIVYSKNAISADGLLDFYNHSFPYVALGDKSYAVVPCSKKLESKFQHLQSSLTFTASGFYGPQFRSSGLSPRFTLDELKVIEFDGQRIGNIEMETAGIYGLSNLLGFEAISINAILAHRGDGSFSSQPEKTINRMIENALEVISDENL